MDLLRITLFGRLRCTLGNDVVGGIEARKVQELLIYLLLHRTHPSTRESLATLLWEERNAVQARKYLRQTLWQLQSAINTACASTVDLLRVDPEWVEFNAAAPVWLDIQQFERVYDATRQLEGRALTTVQADALGEAVSLYTGDLLEGWYQDWCIFERERLQQMYLTMLDKLIAYAEHTCSYDMGVHYCELALRSDSARERTHRRLMRLYYLSGNRTAALRQYDTCVHLLHSELGVEPARSTQSLYEQICTDAFEHVQHRNGAARVELDQAELTTILDHLGAIRSTLLQTLQQVQHEIERVESLLHLPEQTASPLPERSFQRLIR